jgi:hypothetical protein
VIGNDIFAVYQGEGWHFGQKQANQIMHFRRFLGQFGMPLIPRTFKNAPGGANNVPAGRLGNFVYVYTKDGNGRGAHRWRVKAADLR